MPSGFNSELLDLLPTALAIPCGVESGLTGEEAVEYAMSVAGHVDALLLDSSNPALAVKELGGTGRTHDWTLSRHIRDSVRMPVFLAGGLNPGNVAEAIAAVQPFGVDVCSGVRTDDRLDATKLRAFCRAIPAEVA